MAELADAHGSGPCESNFMGVRVPLSAPFFIFEKRDSKPKGHSRKRDSPVSCRVGYGSSRLKEEAQSGRCGAYAKSLYPHHFLFLKKGTRSRKGIAVSETALHISIERICL